MRIIDRLKSALRAFNNVDIGGDPIFYIPTESGGMYVSEQTALSVSAVFSCVEFIAQVMAMLPIELFLRESDGDMFKKLNDPLYKLLRYHPNVFQTPYEFWLFNVECILLRGGFISYISRTKSGKPMALIPVNPDGITRKQDKLGSIYFSGTSQIGSNFIHTFNAEPQNNFLWANYRTFDGLNPISPVKHAALTISVSKAADLYSSRTFKNGAKPSGVLTTPKTLSDAAFKRLKEDFNASFSGSNQGKTAILEEGTEFKGVSMTNEDAQLIESLQYRRSDICGIFRVPPHIIGDTTKAKGWSTLEQQNQDLLSYTFLPYMVNICQSIERSLIPEREWGSTIPEYDTKLLLKSDIQRRTAYYKSMYDTGSMTPNEIRHSEGLNSRDGGNDFVHMANIVPESDKVDNTFDANEKKESTENAA